MQQRTVYDKVNEIVEHALLYGIYRALGLSSTHLYLLLQCMLQLLAAFIYR